VGCGAGGGVGRARGQYLPLYSGGMDGLRKPWYGRIKKVLLYGVWTDEEILVI